MKEDNALIMFKFTIKLFDELSKKLIEDFEESINNEFVFLDHVKNVEKIIGLKLDISDFNKQFRNENPKIQEEQNRKLNQGVLFSVISAFVCELSLKYLIRLNGEKFKNTHNLKKLFDSLNLHQKEYIKKETMQNCKFISNGDFESQLENSSENFVKLRYFYESNEHDLNIIFLKGFKLTLINTIN